jgi:hypothetical protein
MTQPGIDLGRSGWTNPEGFQPAPRSSAPAPVIEVCGAIGPEGWTCDLKPNHLADEHWADTGEAPGLRWRETTVEVTTFGDAKPAMLPGPVEVVVHRAEELSMADTLGKVQVIAERAIESPNPGQWYVALQDVLEAVRG